MSCATVGEKTKLLPAVLSRSIRSSALSALVADSRIAPFRRKLSTNGLFWLTLSASACPNPSWYAEEPASPLGSLRDWGSAALTVELVDERLELGTTLTQGGDFRLIRDLSLEVRIVFL